MTTQKNYRMTAVTLDQIAEIRATIQDQGIKINATETIAYCINKIFWQQKTKNIPSITARITTIYNSGKTKAIASIIIGGAFAIHGFKIIEMNTGVYIAMPQDPERKYHDQCHAVTTEARNAIIDAIMQAYQHKLDEINPA